MSSTVEDFDDEGELIDDPELEAAIAEADADPEGWIDGDEVIRELRDRARSHREGRS